MNKLQFFIDFILFYMSSFLLSFSLLIALFFLQVYSLAKPEIKTDDVLLVQQSEQLWSYLWQERDLYLVQIEGMSVAEKRHLLDVKRIIVFFEQLLLVLFFVLAVLLVLGWRSSQWCVRLRSAGIWGISLLFLAAIFAVFDFKAWFVEFHALLFPAGSWYFPRDSVLIRLFPLSYFQQFVLIYSVLCVTVFSFCIALGYWCSRRKPLSQN